MPTRTGATMSAACVRDHASYDRSQSMHQPDPLADVVSAASHRAHRRVASCVGSFGT